MAVIDQEALRKDLQGQLRRLEKDLIAQIAEVDGLHERLRSEYDRAFKLKRTAATWTEWRDERATQAAVAWVLGTVFVRFCEDNGLLDDACYLTGPAPQRAVLAEESQEEFFGRHPKLTDRDWLLAGFDQIRRSQAGKLLFDEEHNPAYQIPISHDAAKALIAFWRRRTDDGALVHDFTDPTWGTRFLGDLYQHLSESARKTYALLQTPDFVEEFILDLTLTPAIDEFGHDVVRVIDPTCGSGHFLLEVFDRLCKAWHAEEPEKDPHEVVRLALLAVHGVDINPFAVAIARFRLLVAALRTAGFATLAQTKGYDFPLQIAVGDSLIKDRQLSLFDDVDELARFRYATEDLDNYPDMLREGRYHVVVGNPPYVTPKDKRLNDLYREMYRDVCSGKYALSVPFAKRFFDLAKRAEPDGRGSGHVGQITANSFMKREFGRKLITDYLASKIDLTYLVDTSGAYIPGHGTPTVIMIGRPRPAKLGADTVRTVMSVRGEPGVPADPRDGLVWQAILTQYRNAGSESEWISAVNHPREQLASFPWSLTGGGSSRVFELVDTRTNRLGHVIRGKVGFASFPGQDEVFFAPPAWFRRHRIAERRPLITGDAVRDWSRVTKIDAIVPYNQSLEPLAYQSNASWGKHLWLFRETLKGTVGFGGQSRDEAGDTWWSWYRWIPDRYRNPRSITFAEVSTHNRFVFDRGGAVFKQTAPVIKLPETATEDDHLRLVGVLNSSTACFWLKQVCQNKGGSGMGRGVQDEPWENRYQFNGTKLQEFPLPEAYPLELARELDAAGQRLTAVSPAAVAAEGVPTAGRLADAEREWHSIRRRMIALQEELDWQVYAQYGLLTEELTAPAESVPELNLGERAFEIVLARRKKAGAIDTQWFIRHRSTEVTELPDHWSPEYRAVVEKRIEVIESNRYLALIERPECKRRWSTDGWDKLLGNALREWLLDRCEARELWYTPDEYGNPQPRPLTVAQLADELSRDPDVLATAGLYDAARELPMLLADLIDTEHVPFLSKLRYTDSGLEKRTEWESVWEKQRQEDAAPDEPARRAIRETIVVPPKYKSADFRKNSYWSNRGKLDVPKERFISYPASGPANDRSLLIGWAGWDHREQAQALAQLVVERQESDGWTAEQLTPLLAGLHEVLPWVRQWHGGPDPDTGESPADAYDAFLAERLNDLHLTETDLASWQPAPARARRSR
ncbi:BREX-2 system adenine-specific DNA-methyltransferase PglX [Micromonospora sp. NPDC047134]|uniref:BREX-2 system adenine-specific DNA-methyltransferase PglX n=1 Tax=Micromonospora sp. NPDC047134 TaxID=3154340 RepID=UPI0033EE27C2